MRRALERFRVAAVGLYSAFALRLLAATWKVDTEGLEQLDRRIAEGERLIAVLWHGKYYALLPLLRNRNACVFTSESSRGNVIADILRRFGFNGVQLPDHGGEHSLNIMRDTLKNHATAAIAVDGPLGPYHVVHRGAVQLASELGHSIVPLSIATDKKRVMTNRWDKFEMPRMFANIVLMVGEPVSLPDTLSANDLDEWIARIHLALDEVDARAEAQLANEAG